MNASFQLSFYSTMKETIMFRNKLYSGIIAHYENCLNHFGDTHLGVDWKNADDANKRYQVMLDIIRIEKRTINDQTRSDDAVTLLDFGCGTAGLFDYMNNHNISDIIYSGLDISSEFIKVCKTKYPKIFFYNIDILEPDISLPRFDYIIMNGVFTEKVNLSHQEMYKYFCSVIENVFYYCNKGMAFNLRSKQVDIEEFELFHLSLDDLAWFLIEKFGRSFVVRNDYGLEEYTVYLYRKSL